MRKLLSITIMMLATMVASAQGTWEKTVLDGDPLKGTQGGEVYIYTQPETGKFVFWGFDSYQFRLISTEAQFNIDAGYSTYGGSYAGVTVSVGIYDDNDKLVEMFKMWLDREDNRANSFIRTRNAGGMSNPVGQKGKVKKVFKALQSGKGYVRMVAERFNSTDFDLKILPFTE